MIETSQAETQSENEVLTHVDKMVLKRVNALKNIQVKMIDIETKFYEELHQLECKYRNFYEPLSEQRAKIISGEYEPTGDECKWTYGDEADQEGQDIEDITDSVEAKLNLNEEEEVKGVPLFWLQVFKRTSLISDMIQDHDEKVLAHLKGLC
jgi:nucleosome assembly protein 1-like 1